MIDEWLSIMADVNEHDVLEKIKENALIGLMADESTDVSVTKELILYSRVVFNDEEHVYFLKLIRISDGHTETNEQAILLYMQDADIPISRVSSFGSDGAVVMGYLQD